jgi:hypothetical protein
MTTDDAAERLRRHMSPLSDYEALLIDAARAALAGPEADDA